VQAKTLAAETIGIQRDLVLQGGLFEEITLTNYSTEPVTFDLSLSFDADFADLFEIRGTCAPANGQNAASGAAARENPGADSCL
jgi:glycogen debranching enzyme